MSDYGDVQIAKIWRNYASAIAAVYVRAMLADCQPIGPHGGGLHGSGG